MGYFQRMVDIGLARLAARVLVGGHGQCESLVDLFVFLFAYFALEQFEDKLVSP